MIQFDLNGNASLYPHKVNYSDQNEIVEKWALPSKEWWTELQSKWPNEITINNLIEVELTSEQIQRFESVKNYIVDGYGFAEYIETGEFPANILGNGTEEEPVVPSLQEMLEFVAKNFNK